MNLSPDGLRFWHSCERPNPSQTKEEFVKEYEWYLNVVGTVLVWEVPNQLGGVLELFIINPALAIPQPPTTNFPEGYYRILPDNLLEYRCRPQPNIVPANCVSKGMLQAHDNLGPLKFANDIDGGMYLTHRSGL